MKKTPFKLIAFACLVAVNSYAQRFEKPLQEYKVNSDVAIAIEASYAEIEIVEWSKNKVEIQGIMSIQGLPEKEARNIFDGWDISTQAEANKIKIRSSSSNFGNEYFFMNSDKYLGNVIVDIPEISGRVVDMIDSIHFVLPEFDNFPDIDFDMNYNFQFNNDSIAFDYEEFKKNSDYLAEWQERNKDELKRLKEELKESQAEVAKHQQEIQKEIKEAQKEMQKEIQKEIKEAQKEIHKQANAEIHWKADEKAREREYQVQRIMKDRQKVKVKKTLIIKVPRNAKLEMDVDYCKISTTK